MDFELVSAELKRFAKCFHQDFGHMPPGVDDFATEYFRSLTPERRRALGTEVEALLKEWPGQDGRGLRNAWIRLGADWVESASVLRSRLIEWARALHE